MYIIRLSYNVRYNVCYFKANLKEEVHLNTFQFSQLCPKVYGQIKMGLVA